MTLRTVESPREMRKLAETLRAEGKTLGFVPTMGALHEGHLSLVRASRGECQVTVASIFVNPTQFGPQEDFERYPRTFERDRELLEREGCNLLFAPTRAALYPEGFATTVRVERMTDRLCGASRPDFLPGVTLVVAKLFNLARPHVAFFGQKDYQQCLVVRRMAEDLDFGVEVRICPIVREADGLAMSSRNRYLSVAERTQATVLVRALVEANRAYISGERSVGRVIDSMRQVLCTVPEARVDYVEVMDAETLERLERIEGRAVALLALYLGETRLIDNHILGEALDY